MDNTTQLWSWALSIGGATMFFLAGRKLWWAWYLGIGLQVLWGAYAVTTAQWGFLLGCLLYTPVYVFNAVLWTKQHRAGKEGSELHGPGEDPEQPRPVGNTAMEHMDYQPDHLVFYTEATEENSAPLWWCATCETGTDINGQQEEQS